MRKSHDKKTLISVHWQKAGLDVKLDKSTWHGHILQDHFDDMAGKVSLVEAALKECLGKDEVWQWPEDPKNECFVQYPCPHFEPYNHFLRVVIRIRSDKTAEVVTVYPVKDMPTKGVKKYEPS